MIIWLKIAHLGVYSLTSKMFIPISDALRVNVFLPLFGFLSWGRDGALPAPFPSIIVYAISVRITLSSLKIYTKTYSIFRKNLILKIHNISLRIILKFFESFSSSNNLIASFEYSTNSSELKYVKNILYFK